MENRLINKTLSLLAAEYQKKYGDSISSLPDHNFDYFFFSEAAVRLLTQYEDPAPVMEELIDELEARGYLAREHEKFKLTEKGYLAGTSSLITKLIHYLNKNPGIAVVVSIMVFLVSLIALYFGYTKQP